MDKKTLLAVVISLGILLVYNASISRFLPKQPIQTTAQPLQSQPGMDESKDTAYVPVLSGKAPPEAIITEDVIEKDLGLFSVKVSRTQGAITGIFLKEYSTDLLISNFLGMFDPQKDVRYTVEHHDNTLVILGTKENQPVSERTFVFNDDYTVDVSIKTSFLDNSSPGRLVVHIQKDKDSNAARYQEIFYKKDFLKRVPLHSIKKQIAFGPVDFIGYRSNYFCLSLLPNKYDKVFDINSLSQYIVQIIIPIDTANQELKFYLGPQKTKLLKKYQLDDIVNYGFFHLFSVWILYLLTFIFQITHSWGFSIIITTIVINLIMLPLTTKSTKAMKAMQMVQVEIEGLKLKYKDNPQRLNKEVIELYKVHKVNPLSGCLPWLLQIPFFFGFFQILSRFIEIKNAHFLWIKDLTQPDHFFTLPFTLPMNYGNQLNILPLLLIFVMYFQQKLTTQNTAVQNDQQRMLTVFLPIVMGIVFYKFSSALVLYWLMNSITMAFFQYKFLKK